MYRRNIVVIGQLRTDCLAFSAAKPISAASSAVRESQVTPRGCSLGWVQVTRSQPLDELVETVAAGLKPLQQLLLEQP